MSIEVRRNHKGNDAKSILSVNDFIQLVKIDNSVYEIIPDRPVKYYFDFDFTVYDKDDYIPNTFITHVNDIFKEVIFTTLKLKYNIDPIIKECESCGDALKNGITNKKYSLRYYVQNIIARPKIQKTFVEQLNKFIQSNEYFTNKNKMRILDDIYDYIGGDKKLYRFDEGVYDTNRKMRCINSSKDKENRPLNLIGDTKIEDTIISANFSNNCFLDETIPIIKEIQTQQTNMNTNINNSDFALLLSCLDIEKRASKGKYNEWIRVMFAMYNSSTNDNIKENAKLFANWSIQADGFHDNYENAYNMFINCKSNKEAKKLTIRSLHFWAIEDNKQKYSSLFSKKQRYATDDAMASKFIYDDIGDNFKVCKNQIFYKLNNVWTCDIENIKNQVINYILYSSNIYKKEDKDSHPIPYAQNITKAQHIYEALRILIISTKNDDDLLDKFYTSMKGYLCFKDGILNMKTKEFILWEHVPENKFYPVIQINRNFTDHKPNNYNKQFIIDNILKPMFAEQFDIAMKFLSRAFGGHYEDKRWATYMGNRNCGKGVIYDLFETAFGDYLASFELNNMLCTRQTNSFETLDASKRLYWVLPLQFARLAISQEVPSNEELRINSALLKKLTGGGDKIKGKRNYDRKDTEIISSATLFILGNNEVQVATTDCNETRLQLSSYVQFISQDELKYKLESIRDEEGNLYNKAIDENYINSRYKLKDLSIKEKCKQIDIANEFINIIMDYYTDEAIPIINQIHEEENPIIEKINKLFNDEIFVLTKNKDDIIIASEFEEQIKNNSNFQNKKIIEELKAMNLIRTECNKKGEYRKKIVYYGIIKGKNHPDNIQI